MRPCKNAKALPRHELSVSPSAKTSRSIEVRRGSDFVDVDCLPHGLTSLKMAWNEEEIERWTEGGASRDLGSRELGPRLESGLGSGQVSSERRTGLPYRRDLVVTGTTALWKPLPMIDTTATMIGNKNMIAYGMSETKVRRF